MLNKQILSPRICFFFVQLIHIGVRTGVSATRIGSLYRKIGKSLIAAFSNYRLELNSSELGGEQS